MMNRVLKSCAGIAIFGFSTLIGAAGAAGNGGLDPSTRAILGEVVAVAQPVKGDQVSHEKVAAWRASQADLWGQLFDRELPNAAIPQLSLDFHTDKIGVIPGINSNGDSFHLIALEVTPIAVNDPSVSKTVGQENLQRFQEAQGTTNMVFGFLHTERGMRAVLGVSSSYKTEEGATESIFVPMVVASRAATGEVCPIDVEIVDIEIVDVGAQHEFDFGAAQAAGWWDYCKCVAKVLKCELYTAGCIAAAPACVGACAGVCVGTLGLACVACYVACAAGGVALCDTALDCWRDACRSGCVPC